MKYLVIVVVHFTLQNIKKVVSAFHSGVLSSLLAWVVTIVERGFEGYMLNAKLLNTI